MSTLFESLDYNFIEAGSNEYYYDAEELTDAKSAAKAFYDSKNYKNRLNVFKGMSSFQAICLSPAILGSVVDNQRATDPTNQSKFIMVKAHIPELHSVIGNPCDVLDTKLALELKKQTISNLIKNHPWFVGNVTTQTNSISRLPSFGDIIRINFQKNPSGGRMMYGVYKGIIYSSKTNSIEDECKETLIENFNNFPIITLGNASNG